jgi:osmoprotectant transport system permease protein
MNPVLATELALLPDYLSRHLLLSITALAVGVSLSLPLGLALTRTPRLRDTVMLVASAIQTIPGLALLALMVPLLGRIGFLPAVIALVLYSMLPVLRNTITGIDGVDADLVEASRGLGMTEWQMLSRVQLPLAMPVIIAGIRTATVWVVGMATLSTPVGATSLGNYIFSGLQTQNYTAVIVGCVAAALLALVLDGLIRLLEVAVRQRSVRMTGTLCAVFVALLLGGLWPAIDQARRGSGAIAIGAKTFTEQYVLGAAIARVLQQAGFRSRNVDGLGSTVAFDALVGGSIDVYVDYTGTIWSNYMDRSDNPGRDAMLRETRSWLRDEHDVEIVARLGFENAYALAMTGARAEALGIETIADLAKVAPRLRIGGDYEFFGRPEWEALRSGYGLEFADRVSMDSTLMYAAVASGQVDVISAFSTDGRIPAFDLVLLEDTRAALPPYDAVLMAGPAVAADVRAALRVLDGAVSGDAMRAANRHVDLDGGSVNDAARNLVETAVRAR